jgi:aldehyde:ferredoxin oxidoreductase
VRKLLRVDMNEGSIEFEDMPEDYRALGGRGLTSQIVADEVPPTSNPLGPNNELIFAPGIVTGTSAPTSGRLSVGGKSPLTGGIKEANVGTSFSQKLAKLGIGAIVVEGTKGEDNYKCLKITDDGVDLLDAEAWSGIGLYEAFEDIESEFGEDLGVCGVGIAAELSGHNSGIAFNDMEGKPSRYAGRGGLGAVMATRGLKYVLVDDDGAEGVEIEDEATFDRGKKKLADALTEHDVTKPGGALNSYGTSVLINMINESGALPQDNFSRGSDDESAKVSGEKKADVIKERDGERPHRCSPGCLIGCSEVWKNEDGEEVGVLEYESVWALGPNSGIYDLDTIGELNRQCNDLGMDTIEAGNTIAVAMDGGVKDFGDGEGALELMDEIREGTPLGRILVNGTEFTGEAFGVNRIPTVKGQAMPAYDPRGIKGIGTTYATTPMGADHTAGYAIAPEIMGVGGEADPLSPEKAEMSRNLQYSTAVIDTTGHCLFTAFAVLDIPEGLEGMVEEVNGVLGADLTVDDIPDIGKSVIETERKFNSEAGFTKEDDRLPEFMQEEELPPHNDVFDVSDEELDKVFGELGMKES